MHILSIFQLQHYSQPQIQSRAVLYVTVFVVEKEGYLAKSCCDFPKASGWSRILDPAATRIAQDILAWLWGQSS